MAVGQFLGMLIPEMHARALEEAELPAQASHHNFRNNKPNHATLEAMWISWTCLSAIVALGCLFVLSSIAYCKTVRSNPFNLIIWLVVFPDFVFSFFCTFSCLINAALPESSINRVAWSCELQSIYLIFGFAANAWMNSFLGREIFQLLHANRWANRYRPRSFRFIGFTTLAIYSWSIFIAMWSLIPGLPHRTGQLSGLACVPLTYNLGSTIFFWAAFIPCSVLLPMSYIIMLSVRAWWQGLLQQASASAQALAYFHMRIVVVFLLFWLPALVTVYIVPYDSPALFYAGGTWAHLQGLASALLCLSKPDILSASKRLVAQCAPCCCRRAASDACDGLPEETGQRLKKRAQILTVGVISTKRSSIEWTQRSAQGHELSVGAMSFSHSYASSSASPHVAESALVAVSARVCSPSSRSCARSATDESACAETCA